MSLTIPAPLPVWATVEGHPGVVMAYAEQEPVRFTDLNDLRADRLNRNEVQRWWVCLAEFPAPLAGLTMRDPRPEPRVSVTVADPEAGTRLTLAGRLRGGVTQAITPPLEWRREAGSWWTFQVLDPITTISVTRATLDAAAAA